MVNYGKRFEIRFKEDWEKSFPNGVIERIPDQMTMYKGSENVCDFICYDYPNQFFIECKTHAGASIPFDAIPQYERMLKLKGKQGVVAGVVLFLYEKFKVLYFPLEILDILYKQGEKSIGLRHLGKYDILEIPSEKLRKFMISDYRCIKEKYGANN